MPKIDVIDPKGNVVEMDHNIKDPKKLVKKYTKKMCKKSQKTCQRTVRVLFHDTQNVKVYLCKITKKAKPTEIVLGDTVIKADRKIEVSYVRSESL
tara:strand:- start:2487 stop:2774 length:288 start_codon:yes stop_codon:yes gene_type:complete